MAWRKEYRDSLEATRLPEKYIILFDRIAFEKHHYSPTKAERIQKSKHWILTLNAEGPQQPLNQRPDFAQAKRECKRLHDEHLAKTQQNHRRNWRQTQHMQSCTSRSREHAWFKSFACIFAPCKIVVIHVSCRACHCLLARLHFHLLLLSFHRLHRHTTHLEHNEHSGPYERSHCDDLRQCGSFM